MTQSETLFQEAVKYIPGGVNSPVRAFGSIGSTPRFITKADKAYMWDGLVGMRMGTAILILSVPGGL